MSFILWYCSASTTATVTHHVFSLLKTSKILVIPNNTLLYIVSIHHPKLSRYRYPNQSGLTDSHTAVKEPGFTLTSFCIQIWPSLQHPGWPVWNGILSQAPEEVFRVKMFDFRISASYKTKATSLLVYRVFGDLLAFLLSQIKCSRHGKMSGLWMFPVDLVFASEHSLDFAYVDLKFSWQVKCSSASSFEMNSYRGAFSLLQAPPGAQYFHDVSSFSNSCPGWGMIFVCVFSLEEWLR